MANPAETTFCIDSVPRWQREWLRKKKGIINRSGYIQKCINILIEEMDPEYYEMYRGLAEKVIRKHETTPMPERLLHINPNI